jgi:uncharacterized protein YgbK (DUF1537 family)
MATELQKNLAQEIVKNAKRKKPLNKKELVVLSGYDLTTAEKQVPAVFEQKGVQEELNNLGFSSEGAKKVVAEILYKKTARDNDRLKAADMVFDVHGDKAPEKHLVITKKIVKLDV